jgi:hypothetical protein
MCVRLSALVAVHSFLLQVPGQCPLSIFTFCPLCSQCFIISIRLTDCGAKLHPVHCHYPEHEWIEYMCILRSHLQSDNTIPQYPPNFFEMHGWLLDILCISCGHHKHNDTNSFSSTSSSEEGEGLPGSTQGSMEGAQHI